MRIDTILIFSALALIGQPASSDTLTVGSGAKLNVTLDNGSIANVGGAMEGSNLAVQEVGAVTSGNIGSNLELNVAIKGSVANVGAAMEGSAAACQAVGVIGDVMSDCKPTTP